MTDQVIAIQRSRDQTIDSAKGLAIIAIVLGHVLRGYTGAGRFDPDGPIRQVDLGLYSWELVAFAFLAGLFIESSVRRHGAGIYLRSRLGNFLWLYIVWSLLQGFVMLATASVVNGPRSLSATLNLLEPAGQFWFFPWISMASILVVIVAPWKSWIRSLVLLGTTGVLAAVTWGNQGGVTILTQGPSLYVWLVIGSIVGRERFSRAIRRAPLLLVIPFGVGFFTLLPLGANAPTSTYGNHSHWVAFFLGVPLTVLGVVVVFFLARAVAGLPFGIGLAAIGRNSLEIYVAHIIFAAGARIILSIAGVSSLWVAIPICMLIGVGGPLLLARISRFAIPWLFAAPRFLVEPHRNHPRSLPSGSGNEIDQRL